MSGYRPVQTDPKSFFNALFDFSFTSYVTLKFIRVIYAVIVAIIGIGAIIVVISSATRGFGPFIGGLIVAVVGGFLYLILARIYLELVTLLFRITDNTSVMASSLGGGAPGAPGGGAPYGGPGGYPAPGGSPAGGPPPSAPPPSGPPPPGSGGPASDYPPAGDYPPSSDYPPSDDRPPSSP